MNDFDVVTGPSPAKPKPPAARPPREVAALTPPPPSPSPLEGEVGSARESAERSSRALPGGG